MSVLHRSAWKRLPGLASWLVKLSGQHVVAEIRRLPMRTKNRPPGRTEKNWRHAGLLLLVVGIVGAEGAIAVATSGPTCDQQIAQLNSRLLGSTPRADPEALRQRYAAYEKAFAAICGPPASPSPVQPTPGDNEPPYVPREGIFEPAEDILAEWDFVNYWVGHVRDQWVSVYAGSQDADPIQGGVVVVPYGPPARLVPPDARCCGEREDRIGRRHHADAARCERHDLRVRCGI